jgi:hypothetical protein
MLGLNNLAKRRKSLKLSTDIHIRPQIIKLQKIRCEKMQQQFGYAAGTIGDKIASIVDLFKQCGGTSARYKEAVLNLPEQEAQHLTAAINNHVRARQQQQQQHQM